MANEVKIILSVDDKGTATVKRFSVDSTDAFDKLKSKASGASNSIKNDSMQIYSSFDKLKGQIVALGELAGLTYLAHKVYSVAQECINAAGEAEKMGGRFNAVFADQLPQANRWAETLQKSYAMGDDEAKKYLSSSANILKNTGMNSKAAGEYSFELSKLAADQASFNNLDTEDVLKKEQAAMLGKYRGLKELGIVIDDSMVKQEAYNMGLIKKNGTLDKASQAEAVMSLMYKQSANAVGDLARSHDTYATQSKIAKARMDDMKDTLGAALIPYATQFKTEIANITGSTASWIKVNQEFIKSGLDTFLTGTVNILGYVVGAGVRVYETFRLMQAGTQAVCSAILSFISDITGGLGKFLSYMPSYTIFAPMSRGLLSLSAGTKDLAAEYKSSFNSILDTTATTATAIGGVAQRMMDYKSNFASIKGNVITPKGAGPLPEEFEGETGAPGAGDGSNKAVNKLKNDSVVQARADQERIKDIIAENNTELARLTQSRYDYETTKATEAFLDKERLIESLKVSEKEKFTALKANEDIFTATLQGIDAQRLTDQQAAMDEINRIKDEAAGRSLSSLDNKYEAELRQANRRYDDEAAKIKEFYNQKLIDEATYIEASKALQTSHTEKIEDIKSNEKDNISKQEREKWQNTGSAMNQGGNAMMSMAQSQSRGLFNIGKTAALAGAIVNTAAAANEALKNPPGPPYTLPIVAATIVTGMAQVATIAETKFEARQKGGPVYAGKNYIVGEAGIEIFTPQTDGYIVPNNELKIGNDGIISLKLDRDRISAAGGFTTQPLNTYLAMADILSMPEVLKSPTSQVWASYDGDNVTTINNRIGSSRYEAREYGGAVYAGNNYIVGEAGPEMFVPDNKASVIRDKESKGQTSIIHKTEIHVHQDLRGAFIDDKDKLAARTVKVIEDYIADGHSIGAV